MNDKNFNEQFTRNNKHNKWIAIAAVIVTLSLSFSLVYVGFTDNNSKSSVPCKEVTTVGLNNTAQMDYKVSSDTTLNATLNIQQTPIEITDKHCCRITDILPYIGIIVFVVLSLWGAFTVLLKTLKYENEMNVKIFDVHKDIYKETQFRELVSKKEVKKVNESEDNSFEHKNESK